MSEFRLAFKGPQHEFEIQVPVCLLGKPDPDAFNLKGLLGGSSKQEDETEEQETKIKKFIGKTEKKSAKKDDTTEKLGIATGAMLLSAMILSAVNS